MKNRRLTIDWGKAGTPAELHSILETLADEYPIRQGEGNGIRVSFEKTGKIGTCGLRLTESEAIIRYGTPSMAVRALGALMAGLAQKRRELLEQSPFTTFGIMLDCSRNAVMTVDHFKRWLRRLALLGYNMAMLYTEETYELPEEPYFGYLRGRYTAAELRQIDEYAALLGIEMIPCIQTLGHLAQALKWPAYRAIKDTGTVALVGERKTYALIEKMLKRWSSVFKSRRIHVGMDEAHDLGRGQYMDRNGFRNGFDIFNEHLDRVVNLCGQYGLKPMIWSDMYFRLGSTTGNYHDQKCKIPKKVIAKIPKAVDLVYWDYYHRDESFYTDFIERHRSMGFEPLMASGVWTWGKVWHDSGRTQETAGPCISACRKAQVKEIVFTLWGDDGAFCDFDSALAGLAWCAEQSYSHTYNEKTLTARFAAVCDDDYRVQNVAGRLEWMDRGKYLGRQDNAEELDDPNISGGIPLRAAYMLWDDPLMPVVLFDRKDQWKRLESHYAALARKLKPHNGQTAAGKIKHAQLIAEALSARISLTRRLFHAYLTRNNHQLTALRKEIPYLVRLLERTAVSWRSNWMNRNKPFGFESLQNRMAGAVARHKELDRRLAELLSGKIDFIPEWDEMMNRGTGVME